MDQTLVYFAGDVVVSALKKIAHPKGSVYHALKSSDSSFHEFGEAYFTTVLQNEVKGWKKHTAMVLNLVVPVGDVSFYVHNDKTGESVEFRLGDGNYSRLTIKPHYWVAFKGRHPGLNLILNIASIEHDPAEAVNAAVDAYPFPERS